MKQSTATVRDRHAPRRTLFLLAAVIVTSWLAGCERMRLDREVDRLCAIDGGVKVFETVEVPLPVYEDFLRDPGRRVEVIFGPDYQMTTSEPFLVEGNPSLSRTEHHLVRQSDKRVLGIATSYSRRGGDFIGPSAPSAHSCPAIGEMNLEKQVFVLEGTGK